ncbi:hypothetical protein [Psychromicrobium silvestre]|nr:hypothetical protein [Psychromicrobium silvestre]
MSDALAAAAAGLSGSAQMGGSDQNGRSWAADYDHAAAQVFQCGATLQEALGQAATNLGKSAFYYYQAEHANAGLMLGGLSLPAAYPPSMCLAVPSASGGTPNFPKTNPVFEWFEQMVANLIGDLWPDGDRDKLDAAANTWDALAAGFGTAATDLEKISTALGGVSSPEIPKVDAAVANLKSLATSLETTARALGQACRDLSGKINYVHTQTEITLGITIAAVGVTVAAGLGLTVFTFGISDVAAGGAVAGEAAGAAATITGFIAEFAAFVSSTVGGVVAAGAELIGASAGAAALVGSTVGEATAGAVLWGTASAAENTIVTAITEPGASLSDAYVNGFITGAIPGGLLKGAGGLAGALGTKTALDTAEQANLMSELEAQGVKFNAEKIVNIFRDPHGKVIFLEEGNNASGLQHILNKHGTQFAAEGISEGEISSAIETAITQGKIVGTQGKGVTPRIIYEYIFNGEIHKMAITVSGNGYIVGINPG